MTTDLPKKARKAVPEIRANNSDLPVGKKKPETYFLNFIRA